MRTSEGACLFAAVPEAECCCCCAERAMPVILLGAWEVCPKSCWYLLVLSNLNSQQAFMCTLGRRLSTATYLPCDRALFAAFGIRPQDTYLVIRLLNHTWHICNPASIYFMIPGEVLDAEWEERSILMRWTIGGPKHVGREFSAACLFFRRRWRPRRRERSTRWTATRFK